MSAPKFTVSAERVGDRTEYVVAREVKGTAGTAFRSCGLVRDPELARAIESHADVCAALEFVAAEHALEIMNTESERRIRAALAKARGEA